MKYTKTWILTALLLASIVGSSQACDSSLSILQVQLYNRITAADHLLGPGDDDSICFLLGKFGSIKDSADFQLFDVNGNERPFNSSALGDFKLLHPIYYSDNCNRLPEGKWLMPIMIVDNGAGRKALPPSKLAELMNAVLCVNKKLDGQFQLIVPMIIYYYSRRTK